MSCVNIYKNLYGETFDNFRTSTAIAHPSDGRIWKYNDNTNDINLDSGTPIVFSPNIFSQAQNPATNVIDADNGYVAFLRDGNRQQAMTIVGNKLALRPLDEKDETFSWTLKPNSTGYTIQNHNGLAVDLSLNLVRATSTNANWKIVPGQTLRNKLKSLATMVVTQDKDFNILPSCAYPPETFSALDLSSCVFATTQSSTSMTVNTTNNVYPSRGCNISSSSREALRSIVTDSASALYNKDVFEMQRLRDSCIDLQKRIDELWRNIQHEKNKQNDIKDRTNQHNVICSNNIRSITYLTTQEQGLMGTNKSLNNTYMNKAKQEWPNLLKNLAGHISSCGNPQTNIKFVHPDNKRSWKVDSDGRIRLFSGKEMNLVKGSDGRVYNSAKGRVAFLNNNDYKQSVRHSGYRMWLHPFQADKFDFAWHIEKGDGWHWGRNFVRNSLNGSIYSTLGWRYRYPDRTYIRNDYNEDPGYSDYNQYYSSYRDPYFYAGYDSHTDEVLIVSAGDDRLTDWKVLPTDDIPTVNSWYENNKNKTF